MPKAALRTLSMFVVPAVFAVTMQTAVASKPYHARVTDRGATRGQWRNSISSSHNMSLGGKMLDNPIDIGPGTTENDPNVYRDGQPIPYYDINPHGG
jgi:hypothetical protein